jgi:hypothetical protein
MRAMKKLAFLTLLLIAATAFAGEVVKRGDAIPADATLTPLADVLAKPEAFTKDTVVTEGVVEAACSMKGCWMQLGTMRVTFKDYSFFVPKDSKGMKGRIAGVTEIKTLSKEDADHLEHEGAKLTRNEDGTAREVSFVANGVELTK